MKVPFFNSLRNALIILFLWVFSLEVSVKQYRKYLRTRPLACFENVHCSTLLLRQREKYYQLLYEYTEMKNMLNEKCNQTKASKVNSAKGGAL